MNAGHPAPLLLRADGLVRRLATGGPVIGLEGDNDYEEGRLELRPGDRLVLFTDGVLEAARPDGVEFGDAGIVAHAEAHRSAGAADASAALIEAAGAHAGGVLSDDATVLVVTVNPGVAHQQP